MRCSGSNRCFRTRKWKNKQDLNQPDRFLRAEGARHAYCQLRSMRRASRKPPSITHQNFNHGGNPDSRLPLIRRQLVVSTQNSPRSTAHRTLFSERSQQITYRISPRVKRSVMVLCPTFFQVFRAVIRVSILGYCSSVGSDWLRLVARLLSMSNSSVPTGRNWLV
jgi:hypothetical protein